MSGYSATSRAAFKRVDVTAGQRRVIDFLRARPRLKPTRQEIADLSGMKLQTVCARVNELLYDFNPPMLKELAVRDGAHPVELIEYQPATGISQPPEDAARVQTKPEGVRPLGKSAPEPVVPHLPHRMSMTVAEAQRSTGLEAELVRKGRRQFRIWGDDVQICADVDALIHAPDRVAA